MSQSYLTFPEINPVIVELGPVAIRWYGLMYLVGFAAAFWLANRAVKKNLVPWNKDQVGDLLFYGFLGVVLGGRIGYVLFYQFSYFIENPLYLFEITKGGMSFHGGLLGVITAMFWFGKKTNESFWTVADFIAPMVPIGLGAGRLGNFLNSELWGRTTDVPWAIIFPNGGALPRHPSQLYEFALEGVALFFLLMWYQGCNKRMGQVSGMFLLGYGAFRFFIEYFREPDEHLRDMAEFMTMGQVLCVPMILFGLYLIMRKSSAPVTRLASES